MTPEQVVQLLDSLNQIVYLLQVLSISCFFLCGYVSMQFIIHCKNQKHLF